MKQSDAPESKRAGTVCFPKVSGRKSNGRGAGGSVPSSPPVSSGSWTGLSENKGDSGSSKVFSDEVDRLIGGFEPMRGRGKVE